MEGLQGVLLAHGTAAAERKVVSLKASIWCGLVRVPEVGTAISVLELVQVGTQRLYRPFEADVELAELLASDNLTVEEVLGSFAAYMVTKLALLLEWRVIAAVLRRREQLEVVALENH